MDLGQAAIVLLSVLSSLAIGFISSAVAALGDSNRLASLSRFASRPHAGRPTAPWLSPTPAKGEASVLSYRAASAPQPPSRLVTVDASPSCTSLSYRIITDSSR